MFGNLIKDVVGTARLLGQAVAYEGRRLDARSAVVVACTVIGDLLEPIGNFTTWFFVIFLGILIGCLIGLRRWAREREQSGHEAKLESQGPPRGPRFLIAISMPGTLLTALLLAVQVNSGATEAGAIANALPAIAELQRQVGISHEKLDRIAVTLNNVGEEVARTKRETSDDPRKELANLGIQWTTEAFVEALMTGDTRAVPLFLAAGMSAESNHKGTSAVLYVFQPNLPNPVPMLELLVGAGYDPNVALIDTRILPHYSDMLPPHFEAPGLPEEYSAWKRTFAGPALLWVVIRASYDGATENDRKVVDFLRRHGASTELSAAFLDDMRPAWGETSSYKDVSRLVGN
jgi:hypothetical protein